MKHFYKYFGIVAIMLFSFYYTEKIALMMREKDPIYQTIADTKKESGSSFVNATIDEDSIIPGLNGLVINVDKSFQKMKSFGAFNKYYLIYDQIKPQVSLENNKDKIIRNGNSAKKSVSIILENNQELIDYAEKNNIQVSLLIKKDYDMSQGNLELINDETQYFKELDNNLENAKKNKNICVVNVYNENICRKEKKYLVSPSLELSKNIATIKNKVTSGNIILIKQNTKLDDFKILLKQLDFKGLKVIPVSSLISEINEQN